MKYAQEVISLMSAHPGRDFRMKEIVNFVSPGAVNKHEIRRQVLRVLVSLIEDTGTVMKRPHHCSGGYASYRWKSATFDS